MRPAEVIIEVTNHCNLHCQFCHIHSHDASFKRPLGFMPKRIWKNLLKELASWDQTVNLVTHGAGEPLLYPHIRELLREAKAIPNLTVGFMTNGMLLKEDMARFLVDHNVDWLALSIDGTDPNTHDAIRKGARLKTIEKNLSYLIDYKRRTGSLNPQLRFNMVLYPSIVDQKDDYISRWLPHAHSISISTFRPIGQRTLWEGAGYDIEFVPCQLLFHQAVISWKGQLGLCCEDIQLDVSPGSLEDTTLEEIFTSSPVYKHYRQCHEAGQIKDLPLCKDCHVWASSIALEQKEMVIGDIRVNYTKTPSCEIYQQVNHV